MAAKFASTVGKNQLAVIEPNKTHYYQPMWTMVGGGVKTLKQSGRPMSSVLPSDADWIQDRVITFLPDQDTVITEKGDEIEYEYLIVALGLQVDFHKIKGLPDAFDTPGVCSNYSVDTVEKTFECIKNFKGGNAIFTYPNTPVKCPGAPQKIMYLAEDYFSKQKGLRAKTNVMFNSALDVIFGVKKYAACLMKVVEERDINLNFKYNLIEVRPDKKEAIFQRVGIDEPATFRYEMIHITPPMSSPDALKTSPLLVDANGFLNVDKSTLQHKKYPNIFGIGDCTNLPTSRTAAAVAAECGILRQNLTRLMDGKSLKAEYDGYTSCPLVTGYGRCILAEFDYNAQPLETFPIDQGKEMRLMYYLKKDIMPQLYWMRMLKGKWEGPKFIRNMMRFMRSAK